MDQILFAQCTCLNCDMREANTVFRSNEKEVCTRANFLFTLEPFPVFMAWRWQAVLQLPLKALLVQLPEVQRSYQHCTLKLIRWHDSKSRAEGARFIFGALGSKKMATICRILEMTYLIHPYQDCYWLHMELLLTAIVCFWSSLFCYQHPFRARVCRGHPQEGSYLSRINLYRRHPNFLW